MFEEPDPTLWHISLQILQWLGVSSLAGFLALYTAQLGFAPKLFIETIVEKSKKFSSESRIKIKNSGKLPALGIRANVENFRAKTLEAGDKVLTVEWKTDGLIVASRLASGESSEISISPGVNFMGGAQISECSYELIVVYHTKLFWLRKQFKKLWRVELRAFDDGFDWRIQNA